MKQWNIITVIVSLVILTPSKIPSSTILGKSRRKVPANAEASAKLKAHLKRQTEEEEKAEEEGAKKKKIEEEEAKTIEEEKKSEEERNPKEIIFMCIMKF